jgi:hypothetical protein
MDRPPRSTVNRAVSDALRLRLNAAQKRTGTAAASLLGRGKKGSAPSSRRPFETPGGPASS